MSTSLDSETTTELAIQAVMNQLAINEQRSGLAHCHGHESPGLANQRDPLSIGRSQGERVSPNPGHPEAGWKLAEDPALAPTLNPESGIMSTIDRLNREQALKARIVAFFPQDQALIESLCRIIQTYHAAMREIYSEDEITVELHSFSKEEAEHT